LVLSYEFITMHGHLNVKICSININISITKQMVKRNKQDKQMNCRAAGNAGELQRLVLKKQNTTEYRPIT